MELIEKPKSEFMLQQGLDDLHKDSRDWLSEIQFWDVELNFVRKLLLKTALRRAAVDGHAAELEKLQRRFADFRKEAVVGFRKEIEAHEQYLYGLLTGEDKVDYMAYRDKHQPLASRMRQYEMRFRAMKQALFKLVEETN
jgi:hypothetical protein